jgi:hypothetical protein
MYLKALLGAAGLSLAVIVFPASADAAIPFFGPILPAELIQGCAAGWGAVIVVINNLISFAITVAIVFVLPLALAFAGFAFIVNPVNAEMKSKAKGYLWNAVVGIVLALSAWMIVDLVMAVLYDKDEVKSTWASLIVGNGNDLCLKVRGAPDGTGRINQ